MIRVIPNYHGSAKRALEAWLAGPLWGQPIQLGPDKYHVYGARRSSWELIGMEFTADQIVAVFPTTQGEPEQ